MFLFRHPAALLFLALLYFVAGTWSLPLIDRDEPRFAECAREMRERNDFVVPYCNNIYRFDKPPLTYWAQVAAYKAFGENDFAARLPSVLAGALTVLVVYGFALSLYGAETAAAASLIFMTCVQGSLHAKGAVADMLMVLFFTLSTWAAWELADDSRGKNGGTYSCWRPVRWRLVFYLALALGFMAKGPVAWLPLGAVWILAASKRCRGVASRYRFALGMVLVVAIVGAWGIPALLFTNGAFFTVGIGKHVVGRSLTTMEGHGASGWASALAMLPFYFVTVFASFFPWSIRLPWLVRRLWRAWKTNGLANEQYFLATGAFLVFGVFTLVRTKLPHYTLPAFPLMAILLAREFAASGDGFLLIDRWAKRTLVAGFVVFLAAFPALGPLFPGVELIRKSREALTPQMEFASCDFQEPSLAWYARRYVRGFYTAASADKLPEFMAKPGARFCVSPAGTLHAAPDWKIFETTGVNIVHFNPLHPWIKLELMVKER